MSKNRGKARVGKTFVESISIAGATARMAPLGLQIYAADFLAAAKAVPSPVVPFAPARMYLACHAVELALKAFLSLKGHSLDKLASSDFCHDLGKILDEAEQLRLDELMTLDANSDLIRPAIPIHFRPPLRPNFGRLPVDLWTRLYR